MGSLPRLAGPRLGSCPARRPSPALSAPREGYSNPPTSGENLIGLSRARRPHNAIFVNFEGDEVPVQPLEAAVQTWRRVCTNPMDQKVEEELRKVSGPGVSPPRCTLPVYPAGPVLTSSAVCCTDFPCWFISTWEVFTFRRHV